MRLLPLTDSLPEYEISFARYLVDSWVKKYSLVVEVPNSCVLRLYKRDKYGLYVYCRDVIKTPKQSAIKTWVCGWLASCGCSTCRAVYSPKAQTMCSPNSDGSCCQRLGFGLFTLRLYKTKTSTMQLYQKGENRIVWTDCSSSGLLLPSSYCLGDVLTQNKANDYEKN